MSESATRHHRHRDAQRGNERREHNGHLVTDTARGVLVDSRPVQIVQVECVAAAQHGVGQRVRLAAIQAAEETRHEKRRHLVIRHVAGGIGVRERTPLAWLDVSAVPFAFYESEREHLPFCGVSLHMRGNDHRTLP